MTEALQFLQKHRKQGALLDANLLLVYAVGKFNKSLLTSFSHTKQYATDYGLIEYLVENLNVIYTTPNILTEVSNLGGKLKAEDFFNTLGKLFKVLREEYCESTQVAEKSIFTKFGLTDAGIIAVAERNILVVTDDWPLYQILRSREVDAVNINHLRPLYWDKQFHI